jgi:hypothetical protein
LESVGFVLDRLLGKAQAHCTSELQKPENRAKAVFFSLYRGVFLVY